MSLADLRIHEKIDGVTVECRVAPRAGRTAIKGVVDGALRVALAASPVEGKANEALCSFFSALLSIPRSRVEILKGLRGRNKVLLFRGIDSAALHDILAKYNVV